MLTGSTCSGLCVLPWGWLAYVMYGKDISHLSFASVWDCAILDSPDCCTSKPSFLQGREDRRKSGLRLSFNSFFALSFYMWLFQANLLPMRMINFWFNLHITFKLPTIKICYSMPISYPTLAMPAPRNETQAKSLKSEPFSIWDLFVWVLRYPNHFLTPHIKDTKFSLCISNNELEIWLRIHHKANCIYSFEQDKFLLLNVMLLLFHLATTLHVSSIGDNVLTSPLAERANRISYGKRARSTEPSYVWRYSHQRIQCCIHWKSRYCHT